MFCNKCGKELAEGASFCRYCGKPVSPEVRTGAEASPADPTRGLSRQDFVIIAFLLALLLLLVLIIAVT